MKKWLSLFVVAFVLGFNSICPAQEYSYIDLINKLVDLESISTLPANDEFCKQWSSYDRKSHYDEKTGKYVDWDANGDGFGGKGFIRTENGKLVLAEMEGPGCIWRIWSATPQNGHVRIYLDGSESPTVDLPFTGYFDGKTAPFNRPALVHLVASGKNNYTPIPFQKSCKIVADKDYGEFHHFNYTLFPKGTVVPTFTMNLTKEDSAALDKVNQMLEKCGPDFTDYRYPQLSREKIAITVEPGKTEQVVLIEGARAITSLKVKPAAVPSDVEQQRNMMRELALSIYWDKQDSPAVWSPIGDFFGTAPGINYYKSLPLGMTQECFYSNWFMPFENQAVIKITNDGLETRQLEFEIAHAELKEPFTKYAHFHVKWHRNLYLPKEPERGIDWTILTTKGAGRFVGVQLQIWNPKGGWWGEGDEKFFVDGEKFPSTYGTGSEDYFGYAWSDPMLFQNGYHNQTISEGNKGHISVNRWHIMENIPFHTSFESCIEKYFSDERPTHFTCTAYWYLDKNGIDTYPQFALSERVNYYTPLRYPLEIAGIVVYEKPLGYIESEGMQTFTADKWEDDNQLWWTAQKPGNKLKLVIDAPEKGFYRICTRLTKAADFAIVQCYINDKKIGEPVDLYNKDTVIATKELELGTCELNKGANILTVEIIGKNPDAIPAYMFGMDYLKIKKASPLKIL